MYITLQYYKIRTQPVTTQNLFFYVHLYYLHYCANTPYCFSVLRTALLHTLQRGRDAEKIVNPMAQMEIKLLRSLFHYSLAPSFKRIHTMIIKKQMLFKLWYRVSFMGSWFDTDMEFQSLIFEKLRDISPS